MADKKKFLMIIPNQRWCAGDEWSIHPYGICVMIPLIKDMCHVELLDANVDNLSVEEAEARIGHFAPDLVGVSVLSDSHRESGFLACEAAKRVCPNVITIMGGVFVTTRPERAMSCSAVDYGVIGEGEYVLPKLVSFILGHTSSLPEQGIVFRNNGRLEIRPQTQFIENLDELPLPDYSVLDFSKYSMEFRKEVSAPRAIPYGKMVTSRGCPVGCCFCEVEYIAGKTIRSMSPERVITEIQWLIDSYGIRWLEFLDDQLLGKVNRFKTILRMMIERDWDLQWSAHNVSVFFLDEEILDLMKASKCLFTSLAIESGSERVLREIIRKPVKLDHARRMADYARKIGLDTCGLFVIGFPGETWDEIRQTIKLAEDIGFDYVKINIAAPFQGTKLYDLAKETNSFIPGLDLDRVGWGEAVISTDEFTADQLRILRAMEWDRINFGTAEKRENIARMMSIPLEELQRIRRKTINLHLS